MTEADRIREHPDPYRRAIALMEYRLIDREEETITMAFHDGSKIVFKINYEVMSDEQ